MAVSEWRSVLQTATSSQYLPLLYQGASVFVFPSFSEGFGFPVIEAFASGTPVVSSNTSSLPEVCGQSAILVDPYDTEGISESIERIINDSALRNDLIDKGIKRARQFTQKKTFDKVLGVFAEFDNVK